MTHYFTTIERKFIIENSHLFTARDMKEILNCSLSSVYRFLYEVNVRPVKKRSQKPPGKLKEYYTLYFRDLREERAKRKLRAKSSTTEIMAENLTVAAKPPKGKKKPRFLQLEIDFTEPKNENHLYITKIPKMILRHFGNLSSFAGIL